MIQSQSAYCWALAFAANFLLHISLVSQQGVSIPNVAATTPGVGVPITISLTASRAQLTAGSTVGITAIITNTARDSTIYLTQSSITLMQSPELEGPSESIRAWYAYFPTEAQTDVQGKPIHPDSIVLALAPGTSAHVSWWPTRPGVPPEGPISEGRILNETIDQVLNELRFLFFSPGDYQLSVQTKYWTNASRPPQRYYISTQSLAVRVMAPQFVILLGAALGGLIAYSLFPGRRTQQIVEVDKEVGSHRVQRVKRESARLSGSVGLALGAMLWSAIATILLSRLSDTQFVVRVSVNDFWGAIAIGFVAQYAGSKWLEKLLTPSTSAPANLKPEPSDSAPESRLQAPGPVPDMS